jgi:hypothetical protein
MTSPGERRSISVERALDLPQNNELQRTRDGNAAGSPLNSVFYRPFKGGAG